MTIRQLYEAVLIELHKENAPNILLEDFNYLANKAINQFVNKRYNIYDINQQTTDDLRVLKASAVLTPKKISDKYEDLTNTQNMATYEVVLPEDYLHILNCICIYEAQKTFKCYNPGTKVRFAATRLTADAYSLVLDNFWNKPSYKRPYYYIHNINTSVEVPTNPYSKVTKEGTDIPIYKTLGLFPNSGGSPGAGPSASSYPDQIILNSNPLENLVGWKSTLNNDSWEWTALTASDINKHGLYYTSDTNKYYKLTKDSSYAWEELGNELDYWNNPIIDTSSVDIFTESSGTSNIERSAGVRYGNASQVRMEIRYGTDAALFPLIKVYVDYIKAPQNIRLTQEQLDYTEDHSQVLEWPDYVCQEIINELVHIIMENISDLRILTHPVVSLSIANPAQQLASEQA